MKILIFWEKMGLFGLIFCPKWQNGQNFDIKGPVVFQKIRAENRIWQKSNQQSRKILIIIRDEVRTESGPEKSGFSLKTRTQDS